VRSTRSASEFAAHVDAAVSVALSAVSATGRCDSGLHGSPPGDAPRAPRLRATRPAVLDSLATDGAAALDALEADESSLDDRRPGSVRRGDGSAARRAARAAAPPSLLGSGTLTDHDGLLLGTADAHLQPWGWWGASLDADPLTTCGSASTYAPPTPVPPRLAASGSADAELRVWDIASGVCVATLTAHAHPVTHVAWAPRASPDGALWLASADAGGRVALWALSPTGEVLERSLLERQAAAVTGLAFTPDGRKLLTADAGGAVCVWGVGSGAINGWRVKGRG